MSRVSITILMVFFAGVAHAQIPAPPDGNEFVDGTGLESVDGTGMESVDGTGMESVDGTGLQSVDGTGIRSVDGTGLRSFAASGTATGSRYTVRSGDTLGTIAEQFYDDSSEWQRIYKANRNVLSDPNFVPVGIALIIPELE